MMTWKGKVKITYLFKCFLTTVMCNVFVRVVTINRQGFLKGMIWDDSPFWLWLSFLERLTVFHMWINSSDYNNALGAHTHRVQEQWLWFTLTDHTLCLCKNTTNWIQKPDFPERHIADPLGFGSRYHFSLFCPLAKKHNTVRTIIIDTSILQWSTTEQVGDHQRMLTSFTVAIA